MVDDATSECISVVSGVPQGSVLRPLLFTLCTTEMFQLVLNRLYTYADDSTLLVVVCKPADMPAVAASLNGDLARIQEWCNHWFMMLNPNKTKTLMVNRSWTVNHPLGDLVLFGVSICAGLNFDILGLKFDSRLTFEDHVRGIVAQRIFILRFMKPVFVYTSMLLHCYYTSICSPWP